jgi:hypothetical protein
MRDEDRDGADGFVSRLDETGVRKSGDGVAAPLDRTADGASGNNLAALTADETADKAADGGGDNSTGRPMEELANGNTKRGARPGEMADGGSGLDVGPCCETQGRTAISTTRCRRKTAAAATALAERLGLARQ